MTFHPIESLRDGDRVVSYSRHNNHLIGTRRGAGVVTNSRPYSGYLLGVVVGDKTTWCTPSHLWTVRLSDAAANLWCTYLMRKGDWWRVGKAMLISSWGFGLKHRLYAEDGEEAVSVYQSARPDVALMDVVMPKKDGLEALAEIRQLDPLAKVIMLTALNQQSVAVKAVQLGAKDFLIKPIVPDLLVTALQKVLG